MKTDRTFADSLRAVYGHYLQSLADPHTQRIFARDWPADQRRIAEVIRRITRDSPHDDDVVRFVHAASPNDIDHYVLAVLEGFGDSLRFVPISGDEWANIAEADEFTPEGERIA